MPWGGPQELHFTTTWKIRSIACFELASIDACPTLAQVDVAHTIGRDPVIRMRPRVEGTSENERILVESERSPPPIR